MQEWLLGQWERHRQTVLFITHDVEEAIFLSGRILVVDSTPIRSLTEIEVPLPYPRRREMLARPEIDVYKRQRRRCAHVGDDRSASGQDGEIAV